MATKSKLWAEILVEKPKLEYQRGYDYEFFVLFFLKIAEKSFFHNGYIYNLYTVVVMEI